MSLTWSELKDQIAQRERESEMFTATGQYEEYDPYWDPNEVEFLLYDISLQLLREMPVDEWESLPSGIVISHTFTAIYTMPANAMKILSVTYGTTGAPALPLPLASYLQIQATLGHAVAGYTFLNNQINATVPSNPVTVTYLAEPTLADFQNDLIPFPPGYDEIRIDWVHKVLQAMDFMPGGRM